MTYIIITIFLNSNPHFFSIFPLSILMIFIFYFILGLSSAAIKLDFLFLVSQELKIDGPPLEQKNWIKKWILES